MDIDKISLICLALINIILSAKFFSKNKAWNGKTMSILSGHIAASAIVIGEILLYLNKLNLAIFEMILCFALSWMFGLLTMQFSLLSIQELTTKKLTTLWKTPVVAALAGLMLKINFVGYLGVGFTAIAFYVGYQNRTRLRYATKKLFPVLLSLPFFVFMKLQNLWVLNIGLLIYVLATNVFHNMIYASNLLDENEKA